MPIQRTRKSSCFPSSAHKPLTCRLLQEQLHQIQASDNLEAAKPHLYQRFEAEERFTHHPKSHCRTLPPNMLSHRYRQQLRPALKRGAQGGTTPPVPDSKEQYWPLNQAKRKPKELKSIKSGKRAPAPPTHTDALNWAVCTCQEDNTGTAWMCFCESQASLTSRSASLANKPEAPTWFYFQMTPCGSFKEAGLN